MYGEMRGSVLNRAIVETLESRRLLSLTAMPLEGVDERGPELTDEEIAVIAAEKEAAAGSDSSDVVDDLVSSDGDGEIRITMMPEDGVVLDRPEVDENGDPIYYTLEDNVPVEEPSDIPPMDCEVENCEVIYQTTGGTTEVAPVPTVSGGILNVTGTSGDDKIRIRMGNDGKIAVKVNGVTTLFATTGITKIKVDGLAGDDRIIVKRIAIASELTGGAGNDTICGGGGNDLISGGDGEDNLRGNAGDDVLSGGNGDDVLSGGRGSDSLLGGDGRDKVRGGGGDDVLDGSAGHDRIRGGAGRDHSFDNNDTMRDAKKAEKSQRYARPIWWTEDDGSLNENPWWGDDTSGDATQDSARVMLPIWWDPQNPDALPDDTRGSDESIEPIIIDDGSGTVSDDNPADAIMY